MQLDLIYSRMMIGEVGKSRRRAAGAHRCRKVLDKRKEQQFLEQWIASHRSEVKTRVRTLLFLGMAHAGGAARRR